MPLRLGQLNAKSLDNWFENFESNFYWIGTIKTCIPDRNARISSFILLRCDRWSYQNFDNLVTVVLSFLNFFLFLNKTTNHRFKVYMYLLLNSLLYCKGFWCIYRSHNSHLIPFYAFVCDSDCKTLHCWLQHFLVLGKLHLYQRFLI